MGVRQVLLGTIRLDAAVGAQMVADWAEVSARMVAAWTRR